MSDYQAIYDAVRSKISGGNIGEVVERVASNAFDMSHMMAVIQQEFGVAAAEMARPSVVYRPALRLDGTKWMALYGDNLMDGCAGFGDTPAQAMAAFDVAWFTARTPAAAMEDRAMEAKND